MSDPDERLRELFARLQSSRSAAPAMRSSFRDGDNSDDDVPSLGDLFRRRRESSRDISRLRSIFDDKSSANKDKIREFKDRIRTTEMRSRFSRDSPDEEEAKEKIRRYRDTIERLRQGEDIASARAAASRVLPRDSSPRRSISNMMGGRSSRNLSSLVEILDAEKKQDINHRETVMQIMQILDKLEYTADDIESAIKKLNRYERDMIQEDLLIQLLDIAARDKLIDISRMKRIIDPRYIGRYEKFYNDVSGRNNMRDTLVSIRDEIRKSRREQGPKIFN